LRKWREEVTFDALEHGLLVRYASPGDAEAGAILPQRRKRQTQQAAKNGLHHLDYLSKTARIASGE